MKKGVTYIISALFLMLIFTSTVNARISDEIPQYTIKRNDMGDILYVGGSGLHNYSRIQDAVDNASDGDTVFVYDDSSPYYENIIIKKNDLQLIGKNKYSTIIDGNNINSVIEIIGDRVTIRGFTIQHSGSIEYPEYNAGLHLLYPSSHNNITDNIVIDNFNGICLQASKNNTISKNIVSNNVKGFHIFADAVFNIISKNNVEDNNYGFFFGFTVYNDIMENNIANSTEYGMYFYFACVNKIQKNNFVNNTRHVYFIERLRYASDRNNWIRNYWDTWIGFGPKLLKGQMYTEWVGQKLIPWINFDWIPARKPYTIQI
jgi:parallel beta-helix repeat protein